MVRSYGEGAARQVIDLGRDVWYKSQVRLIPGENQKTEGTIRMIPRRGSDCMMLEDISGITQTS